jgi:hypothetical protein
VLKLISVDEGGRIASHLAAACGYKDFLEILLDRDDSIVSLQDNVFGWEAAFYADRCTKLNRAIMLLQKIEPEAEEYVQFLNNPGREGWYRIALPSSQIQSLYDCITFNYTLLHIAVRNDDLKLVECLMRNRFCFHVGNYYGNTAFHYAVRNGSKRIVQLFVEYCTKINAFVSNKNKNVLNPLHLAVQKCNLHILHKCFLESYSDTLASLNPVGSKDNRCWRFLTKLKTMVIFYFA